MRERYKKPIMWTLYGVLFLLCAVVQTSMLGDVRLFGAKLALMPVLIACVSMHQGAERGGIYGLVCGFCWYCSGADGGALPIVTFTVSAIVIGWLCESFLTCRFATALLMSLGAAAFSQGLLLALKCYLGQANGSFFRVYLIGTAASLLACPLIYPAAWGVSKIYREQKI